MCRCHPMNYLIGLVGEKQDAKDFVACFYEIAQKLYKDLYKTKHGRKEVQVKFYCIEDMISSMTNHIMKSSHSKGDVKESVQAMLTSPVWLELMENHLRNDLSLDEIKESYLLVWCKTAEEKEIIELLKGDLIYLYKETKPIKKIDYWKLKWKAIQGNCIAYTYDSKYFWYQTNKTRQYMKSFCVDYLYARNKYFSQVN